MERLIFMKILYCIIFMIATGIDQVFSASIVEDKQISFPIMVFQKTPKEAGYILAQEISNIISFSIQKKSQKLSSTFDLCVVKTLPTSVIVKKDGSTLDAPLYIPLISSVYKNEWSVFTGIDKLTKNIESLKMENLPTVLQFLIYEVNLYTPKRIIQDYTDLNQTYKDKFYNILNGFLSATKGTKNIYVQGITPTDADEAIVIKERLFFEDIPAEPDLCVDVYRSLAQLLPFWIREQDVQTFNNSQLQLTPQLAASYYLKFSDQSAPLPNIVWDGFEKFTLSDKILTTDDLSKAYYRYLKDQYDKESVARTGHKRSESEYQTQSSLFINNTLYKELRIFFEQKRNGAHIKDFSYKNIISFINAYNNRVKKNQEKMKGYDSLKAVLDQGLITDETQKQNLMQLLDNALYAKEQSLDLYKLPADFSFFEAMVNDPSLETLFNEQVLNDDKKVSSRPLPCLKMHYIFEFLPIFYKLHKALSIVANSFEIYFDAMHPDHTAHIESGNIEDILNESITAYNDFKNILHLLRTVYPGIGYIPKIHAKIQHPLLPQERPQDTSTFIKLNEEPVQKQDAQPSAEKKADIRENATQALRQRRTLPFVQPASTGGKILRKMDVKTDASQR